MTSPLKDRSALQSIGETPEAVRARLGQELDQFWAHLQTRQADWTRTQPGREWSPAQEAEHVMMVNGSIASVTRLLVSDKELRPMPQVPGEVKDGKRQAPPSSLPSEQGAAWDGLEAAWTQNRALAEAAAAQVVATPGRTFWHPFFGELDALDWLRVMTGHIASHRLLLEKSA